MSSQPKIAKMSASAWREVLLGTHPDLYRMRRLFQLIPSEPRCKLCNAPFHGIGGRLMSMVGRGPYSKNPLFCETCLVAPVEGVEVEITMLFADVRGSTTLAEKMSASEFGSLMNRFYEAASRVLYQSYAIIDKYVGDEVIGLYIPGFAGVDHAQKAIHAAEELLHVTGHDSSHPWLSIGAGVHTGNAFVGMAGPQDGVGDLTALGDSMNIAARLASQAGAGEILVSEAAYDKAELKLGKEKRTLELKGRSEPVNVYVFNTKEG